MKREKKVKIDRKVLFELLEIYRYQEGNTVKVVSEDDWGYVYEHSVSQSTIKKANNILNNS